MPKLVEVFNKDYIGKLESFSIYMDTILMNGYSGARKSKAKGMSLEFSDFRPYVLGDDIRRIDWNSYGRFDKLFIKLFMEEKQGSINIFIDSSASMQAGEPEKLFYAKQLAASIAYIALRNMDLVNLFAFSDEITNEKKNIQTKNLFPDLLDFLDNLPVNKESRLVNALNKIKNIPMTKGISFIISDFFSEDGYEEAVKLLQYKKQQIVLVQILSPEEIDPTIRGNLRLVDSESGKAKDIELTQDRINNYKKALEKFKNQIQTFCTKRGQQYIFLSTDIPILLGLENCLRR